MWRNGVLVDENFPLVEVSDHLADEQALVWVDLWDPDHEQLLLLAEELGLDPHAVEDAVAHGERTKATRYATHLFFTVYATHLEVGTEKEPPPVESRLFTTRVSAFVLPRGVVTVRKGAPFDVEDFVERWDEHAHLLKFGPGALVHGMLDVIVDGQFETIQGLDDAIEDIEDRLFDDRSRTRVIQQSIYRLRKELVQLRRVILPMRDVVAAAERMRANIGGYHELDSWYTDLYDHVVRATEWTESLRDMLATLFETNLSLQDARLNTVMKKLTAWAAIVAVPAATTGWFGMNLPYPGFGDESGVITATAIIVVASTILFVVFRRRDWI